MWRAVALGLGLAVALTPHARAIEPQAIPPSGESVEWGAPVDGVDLQLATSSRAPAPLPGELPAFEVKARNRSAHTVAFELSLYFPDTEFDGVWRSGQPAPMSGEPRHIVLAPGEESPALGVRVSRDTLFPVEDNGKRVALKSGTHTLRIRAAATITGVDVPRSTIEPVSNPVTIEIPALSSADVRRALVVQTGAGGPNALAAATRLVDEFPNVALDAIEAAIRAMPDPGFRGAFIYQAGRLSGPPVTRFLRSQLVPEAGLFANVSAAQLLRDRKDTTWVPAMIARWRAIRAYLPHDIYEEDAEGQLIALLAASGDVGAIRALVPDDVVPVDVRLAIVETFLPESPDREVGVSSGTGPSAMASMFRRAFGDGPLPNGAVGDAIRDLLKHALDDRSLRLGLEGVFDGAAIKDPRVCDFAAIVVALRWPERHTFHWSGDVEERDAQIAEIRRGLAR